VNNIFHTWRWNAKRFYGIFHRIPNATKMVEADKAEKKAGILTAVSIFILKKTNVLHLH